MEKKDSRKHENYELLNLLGYGLAKFDKEFISQFGFKTKSGFYEYLVQLGVCETVGTVKNRQDMLDPFFDNGRSGWWQKSNQYISRKLFIDSLFGNEDVRGFAKVVKMYLKQDFDIEFEIEKETSPVLKSRFKQLQQTGKEAELYFFNNYDFVDIFKGGTIEDARLFGDGYDFQIENEAKYYLVEVKGVRSTIGGIRLTKNEYEKAVEYKDDYILAVVSNIIETPKITPIANPIFNLELKENIITSTQTSYHTGHLKW